MRDLTEEELKLAPSWASYYCVSEFDMTPHCITFYSEGWHQWVYHISGAWSPKITSERIPRSARVIPTKPFDISKYEFSCWDLAVSADDYSDDLRVYVSGDGFDVSATMNKDDAIAIAKALGVTGDDLK